MARHGDMVTGSKTVDQLTPQALVTLLVEMYFTPEHHGNKRRIQSTRSDKD